MGVVSRLTAQKGFEVAFDAIPAALSRHDARFVALGTGERRYVDFFHALARAFPGRAHYTEGYDDALAHLLGLMRQGWAAKGVLGDFDATE